jgi:hypothetical protein
MIKSECYNNMVKALEEKADKLKIFSSETKNEVLLQESVGILKAIDIIKKVKKEHYEKNT